MTILIPYNIAPCGGPSTFVRAMTKHLATQGHTVMHQAALSFDILFIITECPLILALYAKIRRRRIVQRLDGVYHPGLPGLNGYSYPLKNLRMQIIHNFLADHVVYQSKFAQESCQIMLGQPRGRTSIIYNDVQKIGQVARPGGPPTGARSPALGGARMSGEGRGVTGPAPVIKLITAAKFRRADQIKPILNSVQKLTIPYHLHIYGPYTPNLARLFDSLKGNNAVTCHGLLSHKKLLAALKHHDIFLFSDQSACPNIVLEAMAADLPIVAFNRGSIPELVESGKTGEVVNLAPHQALRDSYPFINKSYQTFAQAISTVAANPKRYQPRGSQKYAITDMLRQYEDILRPT